MRNYRYLALAAGLAVVLVAPAAMASAHPAANKPVLTIGKVGGTAVKNGAKLSASLAKGTDVTFSIGMNYRSQTELNRHQQAQAVS